MESYLGWLGGFLQSLFAFIVILVPLVVFHEFGHFIFARIFNVKAEAFSVGFGPKLWARQFGETEFRISAIPLGGYVKLLGEDRETEIPPEELKRALHKQAPWKRFFIFLGGPLFNFILAIMIFMVMLLIGEPQVASVAGRIVKDSQAEKLGFRSGDRIVEVDGQKINRFDELVIILNENPGKTMTFSVLHRGAAQPETIVAPIASKIGFSIYGEAKQVGEIPGLLPLARSTQVGVSDPGSIAAREGLATGDEILTWNTLPVKTWEEMESQFQQLAPGSAITLEVSGAKSGRARAKRTVQLVKEAGAADLGSAFGLHSTELFVEKAIADSPAAQAGIKKGDRLLAVGGQTVHSFFDLKDAVQKSGEKEGKVALVLERGGEKVSLEIVPTTTDTRDPVLNPIKQYTVGVMPMLTLAEPVTHVERILNPFKLVYKATERMVDFSWRNFVSVKKMITGDVSMGSIGGPLMIGKIAGESMSRGFFVFLTNMAIFSIGLGVLNILPVPVLDGGHLMLLGIEIVRGKPLTMRQMEIIQSVGLILILALMGVAFHNDIARLFYS